MLTMEKIVTILLYGVIAGLLYGTDILIKNLMMHL